jgi:hypothetical protein
MKDFTIYWNVGMPDGEGYVQYNIGVVPRPGVGQYYFWLTRRFAATDHVIAANIMDIVGVVNACSSYAEAKRRLDELCLDKFSNLFK